MRSRDRRVSPSSVAASSIAPRTEPAPADRASVTPLLREPVRDTEVAEQAAALAACSRRLHARGLLAGAEGNCSVRLRDGTLLVTPSGADKASLTAPQVLRRHADGTEVSQRRHR
ncbi:MAG: class II aldolase/adducin family protein, partial [Gemmatimonadaceae bacterium]|nr:class II aldolase/adducin family protein [Gemmatimonadaceae bacterium]